MSHPKKVETVHIESLNNELCLYDWQRMEVHNLNPTAATVWTLCDGQTSPQQMAAQLPGDLTPAQAEELVWLTLSRLEKAHLLQEAVVKPAGHKTLTRRELLKGLGVAAALLPVVSSIVAPGPVAAQSPTALLCSRGISSHRGWDNELPEFPNARTGPSGGWWTPSPIGCKEEPVLWQFAQALCANVQVIYFDQCTTNFDEAYVGYKLWNIGTPEEPYTVEVFCRFDCS